MYIPVHAFIASGYGYSINGLGYALSRLPGEKNGVIARNCA